MNKKISKHISFKEAIHSDFAIKYGIKNNPTDDIVENMKLVAEKIFEPLREWVEAPIRVNSFYRCEQLNTALGGSQFSSHLTGNAIDITSMGGKTNLEMFHYIKDNFEFDQLILEHSLYPKWLNVSYKLENNKQQILMTKKPQTYHTWKPCKYC